MFIVFCVDLGYLFEGHLTVDREPPQPQWLEQSNLLTAAAALFSAQSSQGLGETDTSLEDVASVFETLRNRLEEVVPLVLICYLLSVSDNHSLVSFYCYQMF